MDKYCSNVLPAFERIRAALTDGVGRGELCRMLGISTSTLRRYAREHPEFARLLDECRNELDDRVEQALFRRATGYDVEEGRPRHIPPDVKAAVFWLKNRRPRRWRERREIAMTDSPPIKLIAEEKEL